MRWWEDVSLPKQGNGRCYVLRAECPARYPQELPTWLVAQSVLQKVRPAEMLRKHNFISIQPC